MLTHTLEFDTSQTWYVDLTPDVAAFCASATASTGDGLCNVFVPHATAGLAVIELGAGSEDDLGSLLHRLLPRDDRYDHAHGSDGHGADHLLPALLAPSLAIPVLGGSPALGTWQHVVLVDTNSDNPTRTVRLSLVG